MMEVKKGTRVWSNLTEKLYSVKEVRGMAVVLEAEDGLTSVITEIGSLKLFYNLVNEKRLSNPLFYGKWHSLPLA